jgi:pyridoxamine 5'-phosphate oxidase family protein
MQTLNEPERAYLAGQFIGRLATVDGRGRPQVVPTSFRYDAEAGVIALGGLNMAGSKKFRDVQGNPHAAFVVDEIVSFSPWQVRGVEVRGDAEALTEGGEGLGPGFGGSWIRLVPTRVRSWGLQPAEPSA